APRPLELSEHDEWDHRILQDVLDLDRRLESFGRGFEAQLPPGSGVTPGFYRLLIPTLEREPVTPDVIAGRSVGENLVGLTLVSLDKGDFADRVTAVFGFRGQGASWGLVAFDRSLSPDPVLGSIQAALGRAPLQLAAPPSGLLRNRTTVTTRGRGGSTPTTRPATPGPTTSTTHFVKIPGTGGPTDPVGDALADILGSIIDPLVGPGQGGSGTGGGPPPSPGGLLGP
ncbi:MAG TPA: hypothetical protein VGR41_09410, partial [Actinomycetota bacterium]|nr:hypothetical protein [Actinomycetota bacterium]